MSIFHIISLYWVYYLNLKYIDVTMHNKFIYRFSTIYFSSWFLVLWEWHKHIVIPVKTGIQIRLGFPSRIWEWHCVRQEWFSSNHTLEMNYHPLPRRRSRTGSGGEPCCWHSIKNGFPVKLGMTQAYCHPRPDIHRNKLLRGSSIDMDPPTGGWHRVKKWSWNDRFNTDCSF